MKNFFVPEHLIMDYDFFDQQEVTTHVHQNPEFLAVLEGCMTVIEGSQETYLERGSYYLINSNQNHAIRTEGSALYVCVHINYSLLNRYVDMGRCRFACHSVHAKVDVHQKIKKTFGQILACYFAKSGAGLVKLNVLYYELLDTLGYWLGSDLFSQERDTDRLLTGGVGLLSRDGLKKPSYHAFRFLNRLGSYLIGRGENTVITSNGRDNYIILSHNYRHPNYRYYASSEHEIDLMNRDQYFDYADSLEFLYHIHNVRNGRYQLKVYRVNAESGSIQDEWIRMGQLDHLIAEDVEYLRRISAVRIQASELEAQDNTIRFSSRLERNEIQLIRISYCF